MSKVTQKKRCRKCKVEKPLASFNVNRKTPGPTSRFCADCRAATTATVKRWVERNAARHAETRKQYRSANAEAIRKKNAEYRLRNKDYIRGEDAAYREKNRQLLRDRHKAWRDAHPERAREIIRKWKAFNKDALNAMANRRRARLAGAGGTYTAQEWLALKEAQDWTCLMCGRREPEIKLTVDHVVPVSRGGVNDITNLQGLCKSCNSIKHAKVLDLRRPEPGD